MDDDRPENLGRLLFHKVDLLETIMRDMIGALENRKSALAELNSKPQDKDRMDDRLPKS